MINLFNIPDYKVDTSIFNHYLHGDVVTEFEKEFKNYVGAKYACSINSATNAIFLSMINKNTTVEIPSMIPPVVCNAIITSGNKIKFKDDVDWIGNSYVLHEFDDYKIIDSAQKVDRNQFLNEANDNDLMIFSFYPTKPVGSMDGGIIVSNDWDKIKWFKEAVLNGMSYSKNNWDRRIKFPGYKMYMNSIQCHIALQNLIKLDDKKKRLGDIRDYYNKNLGYKNTSDHLYRILVKNNSDFMKKMYSLGIVCGIHYKPMHQVDTYIKYSSNNKCMISSKLQNQTTSIPFNENLTDGEIEYIVDTIKKIT